MKWQAYKIIYASNRDASYSFPRSIVPAFFLHTHFLSRFSWSFSIFLSWKVLWRKLNRCLLFSFLSFGFCTQIALRWEAAWFVASCVWSFRLHMRHFSVHPPSTSEQEQTASSFHSKWSVNVSLSCLFPLKLYLRTDECKSKTKNRNGTRNRLNFNSSISLWSLATINNRN